MTNEATMLLAFVFLALIPPNIYVAREVRKYARIAPPIDILVLLSQLVDLLALVATVLGIVSFASVLFLFTGIRIIPVPGATIVLIAALLVVSLANVLVLRYLRRKRGPSPGGEA